MRCKAIRARHRSWSGCPASASTGRGGTTPAFAYTIEDASGSDLDDRLPRPESARALSSATPTPACTRSTGCCSRWSTGAAPGRACSSRRRWSTRRSTSPPSRSSSTRPTARCSSAPATGADGGAAEPVPDGDIDECGGADCWVAIAVADRRAVARCATRSAARLGDGPGAGQRRRAAPSTTS